MNKFGKFLFIFPKSLEFWFDFRDLCGSLKSCDYFQKSSVLLYIYDLKSALVLQSMYQKHVDLFAGV